MTPRQLPKYITDENGKPVQLQGAGPQLSFFEHIDRENDLTAQLALAAEKNKAQAAKLKWHRGHLEKRTGGDPEAELMVMAYGVALEAQSWERGQPAPARLRRQALETVRAVWSGQNQLEKKHKVETLLSKLIPASGPTHRGAKGLTKIAYEFLSGKATDSNRTMRGPMLRLYEKTVTKPKRRKG